VFPDVLYTLYLRSTDHSQKSAFSLALSLAPAELTETDVKYIFVVILKCMELWILLGVYYSQIHSSIFGDMVKSPPFMEHECSLDLTVFSSQEPTV
jgi:hypothetical protein